VIQNSKTRPALHTAVCLLQHTVSLTRRDRGSTSESQSCKSIDLITILTGIPLLWCHNNTMVKDYWPSLRTHIMHYYISPFQHFFSAPPLILGKYKSDDQIVQYLHSERTEVDVRLISAFHNILFEECGDQRVGAIIELQLLIMSIDSEASSLNVRGWLCVPRGTIIQIVPTSISLPP
jgi:hypothetical protein